MIFIFSMSTGAGSSGHSIRLIGVILQRISPSLLASLSAYQLDALNFGLRKLAHLSEYTALMLLSVRAFQYGRPELRWRSFIGALGLSIFFAMSDELHQILTPGRTPAIRDVLIDSSGAILCFVVLAGYFMLKSLERRLRNKPD
jgi:VanZ family protein